MAVSTKVTRSVGWKIEGTPGTYDAPAVQMPFTTFGVKQSFDLIEDKSIVGVAHATLPVQGGRHVAGPIAGEVDVATIGVLLEAITGNAVSSSSYSVALQKNEKTLSFVSLDAVKTNKYAGCVVNNFKLSSKSGELLMFGGDVLGWTAELRDDTAFPTLSTVPTTKLSHLHAGQANGYIRIGDQANALTSGDNYANIDSIEVGHNWQFGETMVNAAGTLQLLSGQAGRPAGTFNFTVAVHEADTFRAWRDARTALQAEILYYAAATAQFKIQIANFIIKDVADNDDNVTKLPVECVVARNGIGTSYSNASMAWVTPFKFTVTNS